MNIQSSSQMPTVRPRLEWLDALRGMTMLLVVAYHVAQISFQLPLKQSASMPFLVLLRMPLFFFVSGFLAFSPHTVWNGSAFLRAVGRKIRVQLLPTVVFLLLYVGFMYAGNWDTLVSFLQSPTKGGYWFTWVLLIMFAIYYLLELLLWWLEKHFCGRPAVRGTLSLCVLGCVWGVALLWYETAYLPAWFSYLRQSFWQWSSFIQLALYFHFFLFGNLVRRRWDFVQHLLDSRWFFALLVILIILCCGDVLHWHTLRLGWTNLPRTLAMYALLLLVVGTFRFYSAVFSRSTYLGQTLQYVGQRTLDIYLLHFFFLPSLPMVGQWLGNVRPGFLVEQVLTLGVGGCVVLLSCLVSHVLRVSALLRFYLFGRK